MSLIIHVAEKMVAEDCISLVEKGIVAQQYSKNREDLVREIISSNADEEKIRHFILDVIAENEMKSKILKFYENDKLVSITFFSSYSEARWAMYSQLKKKVNKKNRVLVPELSFPIKESLISGDNYSLLIYAAYSYGTGSSYNWAICDSI